MIVYLARDIPAFVMYCVNGESGSSLLTESTDSMIESTNSMIHSQPADHSRPHVLIITLRPNKNITSWYDDGTRHDAYVYS